MGARSFKIASKKTTRAISVRTPGKVVSLDERRFLSRKRVYKGDQVRCEVFTPEGSLHGLLLDKTPDGMGIAIRPGKYRGNLENLETIQVQLKTIAGDSFPMLCKVVSRSKMSVQREEYIRLGVKVSGSLISDLDFVRIAGSGFEIPEFLAPQAFAESSVFFSNMMLFRVVSLSARGGTLVTSLSNKSVILGVPFNLTVLFPNHGQIVFVAVPLRVRKNKANSKTFLVDVEFKNVGPHALEAMSELILMSTHGTSLEELRNAGLFVGRIENSIQLTYPLNKEDFDSIFQLRLRAYHDVGKLLDKANAEDMRDRFDSYSRHLLLKVGGVLAGAMRIVFVGKDLERSEHHDLGVEIPKFIRDGGFVEFSRVCTHPDYRGSDITLRMVQECIRITVQANMPYALANCNADLWPLYKGIGARKVGSPFKAFGRDDCQLIVFDALKIMRAQRGNVFVWNQLTFPVAEFVHQFHSGFSRILMAPVLLFHSLLAPIVRVMYRRKLYKKHVAKEEARLLEEK